MKKILFSLVLLSLMIMPFLAIATAPPGPPEGAIREPGHIIEFLNLILGWLFAAFLTIAVIFLIIAGFTFLTASGDTDKVTRARRMLTYALIGVAVAVGSRGLVALIEHLVGRPV